MTTRKSFFNKGIYKSSLIRFKWGSVAYFIILFLTTCLPILMSSPRDFGFVKTPLILRGEYIGFPVAAAVAVPVVVSLLLFRFIHGKKQNVFIHSLPVTRTENYISSLLSGLTLMVLPVIANGAALMLISFKYANLISIYDCVLWILINLVVLFIMFSFAALAAVITGNSFAVIPFYAAINLLLPGAVLAVVSLGRVFIHGFPQNGVMPERIIEYTPIFWVVENAVNPLKMDCKILSAYIALAVVIYIVSGILYVIRKNEKSGDTTAFKCLNPIIKYAVTLCAALIILAVLCSYENTSAAMFVIFVLIISAVGYFASEMVLKKSVRVFGSYKGFIGFCAAAVISVCVISFTNCFGYVSYVPNAGEVKSVSIESWYGFGDNSAFSADREAVDFVISTHEKLKTPKSFMNKNAFYYDGNSSDMTIQYEKNNGSIIRRTYRVSHDEHIKLLSKMYSFDDYKKQYNVVFGLKPENIAYIDVSNNYGASFSFSSDKEIEEFLKLYRSEAENLDYEKTYTSEGDYFDIGFNMEETDVNGRSYIKYEHTIVNRSFEKTFDWCAERVRAENAVEN